MHELDILDLGTRKKVLKDIKSMENKERKRESLMRYEVFQDRQARYVIEKLQEEFEHKTVKEMRKITSINLAPRIIQEMADLYVDPPSRNFKNADEDQKEQILEWYHLTQVDRCLNRSNKLFKLNNQAILQVVPVKGFLKVRVLMPHQVDVIPDPEDPEHGMIWIVSVFDKTDDIQNLTDSFGFRREIIDGQQQKIANPDDWKRKAERYEVWSDDYNFIMDGNGDILSDDIVNSLGKAPFIDIAGDKDFEFWVRRGNGIVDFSLDFGKILSDTANTVRLQAYAQAVISSEKAPTNLTVGPNQLLHLEIDSNKPIQPSFQFVSPNPDLSGSIDFLETTLRLFLTSKGVDPKSIVARGDAKSYSSGVERLLAMIESFERSKEDIELYHIVEDKVFNLMMSWVSVLSGSGLLDDKYYRTVVSDDIELSAHFNEPSMLQTQKDREDSLLKLMKEGLMTKAEVMVELFGMSLEEAEEKVEKIREERQSNLPPQLLGANNSEGEDSEDASNEAEGNQEGDRAED